MDPSPYRSPTFPDGPELDRQGWVLLKRVLFGLALGLSALAALFSLWGVIYFHWESTRQLPVEEIEEATYAMHAWFFYLVVSTIACIVFAVLSFMAMAAPRRLPPVTHGGKPEPMGNRP
jgi:hypothetical protein